MRCLSWDKKSPNRSGREWVRLGLVLPFLLVACSVQASPIASSSIHAASDQRNLSAWEAFLAGAVLKAIATTDERSCALVQKTVLGSLSRAKATIQRVEIAGAISWRIG